MIQNIIVANYIGGQIVHKCIAAENVPDEMIRDGWVEITRETPPSITAIIHQGDLEGLYTSVPAIQLKVIDLDVADRPEQERSKLQVLHQKDYYHKIKA